MNVICLIPARGGSKGIPGKNMISILGKPLISYSIELALNIKQISSIWVSSDDQKILDFAGMFERVKVHKRDPQLASDTSPVSETILEIFKLESDADALLLLQPTSPIRTVQQIQDCLHILETNFHTNTVVSVCEMDDLHPARMYWEQNGVLNGILPKFETARRQDIPVALYRNGAIYLIRKGPFFETKKVINHPVVGYKMPYAQLLNIDEPRDLVIAEPIMKAWQSGLL